MNISARVVPEGGMFRLEIKVFRAVGAMPEQTEQLEPKRFFSRSEARQFARNSYGLKDTQIS